MNTLLLTRRHLKLGWCLLLFFLSMGIALEAMHGFKLGWYLDVSNETRRLMWRLAHAHGVLVALVHIAFALTIAHLGEVKGGWPRIGSMGLNLAGFLLPGGFLLGGIIVHEADPWLGVLLVPLGALALFFGVAAVALRVLRER